MRPFDKTGEFQGLSQQAQISKLAVRSAGITIFAQASIFVIQMLGTFVLARMLSPGDFGLVTMVTTFSLLLASFGLAGFTEAVLQSERIDRRLASNLFWINAGGGLAVSIAFAAAGPLLAHIYSDPRIVRVAIGFGLAIFLSVASVIHLSLLKRAMRFAAASVNDIAGRFVYVVVAIVAAYRGWGYWALVAAAVAQPLSVCIGAWILCPWIPGLPRLAGGTGKMVRYASHVYGRFSLNYCTGNTDNLLVGWRFGASALGYYKKAFDLFVLPSWQLMSPVLAVVVTTLSRKNGDREDYKRYFLKGLGLVAFVGMAAGADLTLIGRDLVRLLLGDKWGESGRIFTYFAPGIGFMLLYQTVGWIHLSLGTTGRWLRWTVVELAVTGALFLFGLHWGPAGIAASWTASFCILIVPAFWYAGQTIDLRVTTVIRTVWRYALAAPVAALCCLAITHALQWTSLLAGSGWARAIAGISTYSALFAIVYLAVVMILFGGVRPLREVMQLVPDLFPGIAARMRSRAANRSVESTLPAAESAEQEAVLEGKY